MKRCLAGARHAPKATWILAPLWLLFSLPVRADEVKVVLGPTAVHGYAEADGERAREALAEALRMQGLTVTQLPRAPGEAIGARGCDLGCGARLLAAAGADMSGWVKLSKSQAADSGHATVTLLDSGGHRYEGRVDVRDGDVREATTRALLDARAYQLLGPGPWLRVAGTPEGAVVLVDGEPVGALPHRGSIAPGRHQLIVREPGYAPWQQTLDVADDETRKLEFDVALEPAQVSAEAAQAQASSSPALARRAAEPASASRSWLIAPVAIGTLGVALATAVSVRIATGTSECVAPDAYGLCAQERVVRVWPTAAGYALSAVLIGGSITWIVLGLNSESAPAAEPRIQARVGLGHVGLSGRF